MEITTTPYETPASNQLPYPTDLGRALVLAPLLFFRLGLGNVLALLRLCVLTTKGRRTGEPRRVPLEYRRHGSKIYVVSAWGERPHWYQNLLANPAATLQIGGQNLSVRATPVTESAEALRVLFMFRKAAPARYDAVLSRLAESKVSGRNLPIVSSQFTIMRLDVVEDALPLPTLTSEWAWLWPIALGMLLMLLVRNNRADKA